MSIKPSTRSKAYVYNRLFLVPIHLIVKMTVIVITTATTATVTEFCYYEALQSAVQHVGQQPGSRRPLPDLRQKDYLRSSNGSYLFMVRIGSDPRVYGVGFIVRIPLARN